ncbi:MAG: ATP-grasp domain-containing protein [Labilithrix sp.]|nr:ATP-grasp domain-containing protein [Labilithrix sp.]
MNEALRVALAYNLKRITPAHGGEHDEEAEYDGPSTIASIRDAIASHGHEVIDLEAGAGFVDAVIAARPDVVFNVAEGAGGRSREAQVPALLEMLDIPYTGSDPACLVVTLDKAVAKAVLAKVGVRTPPSVVMMRGDEPLPEGFCFPVIVKPVAEGSSKGVLAASVATSEEQARERARATASRYKQGALVEEYLPGREFTVAILGGAVLPPMEIVLVTGEEHPVYAFHHKLEPTHEVRYEAPARVPPELDRELRDVARAAYEALGCRDVARVDLRLDREGRVSFIECNPLPGLTPGWSDLCLIAESVGIGYRELIGRILEPALARRRARRVAAARVDEEQLAFAL